jgi:hypothetical protein
MRIVIVPDKCRHIVSVDKCMSLVLISVGLLVLFIGVDILLVFIIVGLLVLLISVDLLLVFIIVRLCRFDVSTECSAHLGGSPVTEQQSQTNQLMRSHSGCGTCGFFTWVQASDLRYGARGAC